MTHKPVHDIQCDASTKLDDIASRTRVDLDLLRITLAYIAIINTTSSSTATSAVANATDFHPTITDVKQMISHSEDISAAQLSTTTTYVSALISDLYPYLMIRLNSAVVDLLKLLPDVTTPVAELVEFICRVNSNAHALVHQHTCTRTHKPYD
jgi:hypothetical protein